jgi:LysR family transcriptional activator of nhaA
MDELNYLHLYYFWIASTERGFLKASQKLGMSQSTISTQIQNLEKQLKVRLIQRGPRSFELTDQGQKTFTYCQSVFNHGRELVKSLKNDSEGPQTSIVRIGIEKGICKELQRDFLQSLMKREGFMFMVELGTGDELVSRLNGRQLDVVFSNTRPSPNAARPSKMKTVMISSALLVGKKKWRRKKKGASEFTDVPLFLPPSDSPLRQGLERWARQTSFKKVRVESADESLLKSLALSGEGVALLPRLAVRAEIKAGELMPLHEFRELESTYWIGQGRHREKDADFQELLKKIQI